MVIMKCPFCGYEWEKRVERPKACPECKRRLARAEARRIQGELDSLGPEFSEDGIVRTVLRERILQEKNVGEERG